MPTPDGTSVPAVGAPAGMADAADTAVRFDLDGTLVAFVAAIREAEFAAAETAPALDSLR